MKTLIAMVLIVSSSVFAGAQEHRKETGSGSDAAIEAFQALAMKIVAAPPDRVGEHLEAIKSVLPAMIDGGGKAYVLLRGYQYQGRNFDGILDNLDKTCESIVKKHGVKKIWEEIEKYHVVRQVAGAGNTLTADYLKEVGADAFIDKILEFLKDDGMRLRAITWIAHGRLAGHEVVEQTEKGTVIKIRDTRVSWKKKRVVEALIDLVEDETAGYDPSKGQTISHVRYVIQALEKLTGHNFQGNRNLWKFWWFVNKEKFQEE